MAVALAPTALPLPRVPVAAAEPCVAGSASIITSTAASTDGGQASSFAEQLSQLARSRMSRSAETAQALAKPAKPAKAIDSTPAGAAGEPCPAAAAAGAAQAVAPSTNPGTANSTQRPAAEAAIAASGVAVAVAVALEGDLPVPGQPLELAGADEPTLVDDAPSSPADPAAAPGAQAMADWIAGLLLPQPPPPMPTPPSPPAADVGVADPDGMKLIEAGATGLALAAGLPTGGRNAVRSAEPAASPGDAAPADMARTEERPDPAEPAGTEPVSAADVPATPAAVPAPDPTLVQASTPPMAGQRSITDTPNNNPAAGLGSDAPRGLRATAESPAERNQPDTASQQPLALTAATAPGAVIEAGPGNSAARNEAHAPAFSQLLEAASLATASTQPTSVAQTGAAAVDLTLPTPVTDPDFREALGVQVSVLARDGVQHAELHLNPGDMGPISVRIALDGNRAQVDFGVDSAVTRALVESGLPELASALRDAGLTLTGGGVSQHARGQPGDAPGGRPGDGSPPGQRGSARTGAGEPDTAAADLPRTRQLRVAGGVDLYA